MGNQREIRQIEPSSRLGVYIPIVGGSTDGIQSILDRNRTGHFYTYLCHGGEGQRITNMDGADSYLGTVSHPAFIIQSGGKMWCGYDEFKEHLGVCRS